MRLIYHLFFFCLLQMGLSAAVYKKPSPQFNPRIEVSALFIEDGSKVLLLHRQEDKTHGNTWAIPGGKLERGESPLQTVIREVKEETGIDFTEQQITHLASVCVEHNEKDHFIYHMFRAKMTSDLASIRINGKEHKGFTWVTPQDALKMNLMPDEDTCFKLIYQIQERRLN